MVLKRRTWSLWLIAVLAFVVSGCLESKPPAKLNAPASVKTAYLLTYPDRPDVDPVPETVSNGIIAELGKRNLQPEHIGMAQAEGEFQKKRDTRARLDILAAAADGAPFVVLVETRVRFYSLLTGRFRWDVDAKVTIAPTDDLGRAQSQNFSLPAFLDFEHQDEADALRAVEPTLSERVGLAVDRYLRGRDDVTATARAPVEVDTNETPPSGAESPPFEVGDAIYFVMLDRFHNGVPDNDQTTDLDDPQAWHGGDIAGLTQRLDYLKDLGMSHVWVSPVWDARDTKFYGHGAFHGYWTEDLSRVEPRLGTRAELEKLAGEMRRRNMGLLLDMVLNHVGPEAPLAKEKPDWFHGLGGISDWNSPKQITDHDVHGLPDLDQDNPEVYRHLLETSLMWQRALRPAGFRLDAVKHIDDGFWQRYNPAIIEAAGGDFVMLGEVLDGNPRVTAQAMKTGQFNALFDFPLHFALVDVFCRDAHAGRIGAILGADRLYPETVHAARRRGLVTLLDNHDLPRIVSVCGDDASKVADAMEMMLSLRGTPSFTWGTEIPLAGDKEPENRADMDFTVEPKLAPLMTSLIDLRHNFPVLVDGLDEVVELNKDRLVLARVLPDSAAIVVFDRQRRDAAPAPAWFKGTPDLGTLRKGMVMTGGETVSVTVTMGDFSQVYRRLSDRPTRAVEITVSGAPGLVRLAGSAPEVGAWQFAGAAPVVDGKVTLELPVGEVVALKLAAEVDGEEVWEQRADRFVLVEPGEDAIQLALGWEKDVDVEFVD